MGAPLSTHAVLTGAGFLQCGDPVQARIYRDDAVKQTREEFSDDALVSTTSPGLKAISCRTQARRTRASVTCCRAQCTCLGRRSIIIRTNFFIGLVEASQNDDARRQLGWQAQSRCRVVGEAMSGVTIAEPIPQAFAMASAIAASSSKWRRSSVGVRISTKT